MRILLVSDLHYTLPQLDWVVRAAASFDLVVMAGDHLDISSTVSLDAQSVVSSGNHDLTGPDTQREQAALWLADARAAGVPSDGDSLLLGNTWVFNAGHQIGPVPTRIEIDLAAGTASWRSMLGSEDLRPAFRRALVSFDAASAHRFFSVRGCAGSRD